MNFGLVFTMIMACTQGTMAARLGFHGAIYQYADFGNLSPKQVVAIKKILKQKCIEMYGPRFC